MGKIKWLGSFLSHYKYLIVVVLGVAIVGFVDDESILQRIKIDGQISEVEAEIERYNTEYEKDASRLSELKRDPRAAVKIAREQYFMKTDDEDIYVLSDDNTTTDGKE